MTAPAASPPSTRPLIGLTFNLFGAQPRPFYKNKELYVLERSMVEAIERAGGVPVPLTLSERPAVVDALVARIDALLLTGGHDVAPSSYGEEPRRAVWRGQAERDRAEARWIAACLAHRRPILGICRGVQMLNVALGGTLWQDLTTQRGGGTLVHRDADRYDALAHGVRIEPSSRLARILGATELEVCTVHHQAIRRLAPGLRAVAWAPDGVIEGIEHTDPDRWVLGVQWHPEWMPDDAAQRRLFVAFVHAAERQRVSADTTE